MTIETAISELAGIILRMRWQAFGGEQYLNEAFRRAERIRRTFGKTEGGTRNPETLQREIEDLGGASAQCSLTESFQEGYQAAIREVLDLFQREKGQQ